MHQSTAQIKQNNAYRRKKGLKLNIKNQLEILHQNLKLVDQLFRNRVDNQDLIKNQNLNIFSNTNRQFYEGQWIDVKDL